MGAEAPTTTEITPFHVDIPGGGARRPAPAHRRDALAEQGDWSTTARRACSWRRSRRSPTTGRTSTTSARVEARLNALPQFMTEIDGVDIHFIHVRSQHEDALPLIMTHGWPGSVIEMLDADRPADRPDRAWRQRRGRVPPRAAVPAGLRLLGRAGRDRLGPGPDRTGLGRADAPPRLHPLRRPGRRRGRRRHRRDGPPGTRGPDRHPHEPARAGAERRRAAAGGHRAGTSRRARAIAHLPDSGNGYFVELSTRPQTIGYALLDSPVALAAWMLDHDTDAYYKIARAFVDGQAVGQPHPRPHPRQRHALLADRHRRLGSPVVLGGLRTRRAGRAAAAAAGVDDPVRLHDVPGRDLADAAQLGRGSPTRTSSTSTRSTRAATSPPGRSPSSSRPSCAPRSGRCA